MADEKTELWLTRDELRGMPESFFNRLTEGVNEHLGYLWVPTKTPFSLPLLNYAANEATRKRVYYALMNRMPENIPLHQELVLLRDETARLSGWQNHFAFRTSQKMVGTPQTVSRLIEEVRTALEPVAVRTASELRQLKTEEAIARGDIADEVKLFHWGRAYFETKLDGKAGNAESLISEYFELNTTLQKLLGIYVHIFGIRLVPVELYNATLHDQKLIWHEDVRMFSAWGIDEPEPRFLGYAYLDLFPREGKYTHAGQYTLQRVSA